MSADLIPLNEINEYEWWSYWAEHFKNSYFYTFKSDFYREQLFNRIGFFSGKTELLPKPLDPHVSFFIPIVPGYWKIEKQLINAGYTAVSRMDVYNLKGPIKANGDGIEIIKEGGLDKWISAYVRSFDEDINLVPHIRDSLKRALDGGRTVLIARQEQNEYVGVAALYEGKNSAGIYCVGVLPKYRHRKIGMGLVNFASTLTYKPVFLQAFSSAALGKFYTKIGFNLAYSKEVLDKRPLKRQGTCFTNFYVERDTAPGVYNLNQVFGGLDDCNAANSLLPSGDLNSTRVAVENGRGYMYVLDEKIHVNSQYLRSADIRYLYLDILHELIHVYQSKKGMNLYDTRFSYFKRPTEIEAYRFTISEALKIGMNKAEIIEYLNVEWVTEDEFNEFLSSMNFV
ncbi:MAG: GNAT family N-acetyltransferase [Nitrososphaeria archaeon]